MTDNQTIIRIAAKGDGVTADGRYARFAAPGDLLLADGSVAPGPHHAVPVCKHFGICGGCELQHVDDEALERFVSDRVIGALAGVGLSAEAVEPAHLSPPRTRRRASLRAMSKGGRIVIGFNAAASHDIVDMQMCEVLHPDLFALVDPLRRMLSRWGGRLAVGVEMVLADQGVDLKLTGLTADNLQRSMALGDFAEAQKLARLTIDQGYGPESLWEPDPATIMLSGVAVPLPTGAFLQATREGEAALVAAARAALEPSHTIADLFAGLGTFALALAPGRRVYAAEAAREPLMALKQASDRCQLGIAAAHRDLFRNPLLPDELNRFDAVLLDPPRAGAKEQVERIAESTLARVCYVSCNPASWAKDVRRLTEAGFRVERVWPVGQFRWSTHVELASLLVR